MPVATRSANHGGEPTPKQGDDDDERCVICLSSMDCASKVTLHCKHALHGQCAVRHLQLDSRCPLCRKKPRSAIVDEDDDEDTEQRMLDDSEDVGESEDEDEEEDE
eukprot:gene18794-62449_t